jgi:2-keto-4-pentenoate hydratase/2-oxohepta-3-ene-1,7-dioic acid hydratase in catechol pathway
MKIATYQWGGKRHVGLVSKDGKQVTPLDFGEMGNRVAAKRGAQALIERMTAGKGLPGEAGVSVALSAVKLEAPLPLPRRNLFCVGKNYYDHAKEFAGSGLDSSSTSMADAIPTDPIIFSKVPECVVGPTDSIRLPTGVSDQIDYEVELAVVIGKEGRRISRSSAMDHVWGYTLVNDVTARDWQGRHKQWLMGKSFDTFCPMGPFLCCTNELDGRQTMVRTWVNGELRQEANTRDLIFDIPTLIECISAGITLYPGDIIATGTPKGVGIGFEPKRFLKRGDVVKCAIDGIGTIENRCD